MININKFNDLHGDEPKEPQREWNSQHTVYHFKYKTYPTNTSPLVSDIIGRINHHTIDNGDVEVHPSEFPIEFDSESVPDPDTTLIK